MPDKIERIKSTVTATFDASREQQCREWLEKFGAKRNIYFAVNVPKSDVIEKCKREEIQTMIALHVDIDPAAGEPFDIERTRILSMLSPDKLAEKNLPPASAIIDSGGGYQAFWFLEQPLELNCSKANAEDAKLYNLKIEIALVQDSCHDVSHIMRLPGTINRPNKLKRDKGRGEALARVENFDDVKYGLDRFTKAPAIKQQLSNAETHAPSNIARIETLDNLPVAEWCKALINVGYDPNKPHPLLPRKYDSRSEAQFAVSCELVRVGVADDVHYSILTDPRFGITPSVIDKGNRAGKYAERQIAQAHDTVDTDAVSRINRRYFAALEGKKVLYFREEDDNTLSAMTADSFAFEVATIKQTFIDGNGKPKEIPALPVWRESAAADILGAALCSILHIRNATINTICGRVSALNLRRVTGRLCAGI